MRAGTWPGRRSTRSSTAGAAGLWPELAFLIDVDPSVARGRRKVAKILMPDHRPGSRKGLTGGGLQQKLREGYRALAARDPDRWIVVDNSDADLQQVIDWVVSNILRAREAGAVAAGGLAIAPAPTPPPDTASEPIADPFAAPRHLPGLGRSTQWARAPARRLRPGRAVGRRRRRAAPGARRAGAAGDRPRAEGTVRRGVVAAPPAAARRRPARGRCIAGRGRRRGQRGLGVARDPERRRARRGGREPRGARRRDRLGVARRSLSAVARRRPDVAGAARYPAVLGDARALAARPRRRGGGGLGLRGGAGRRPRGDGARRGAGLGAAQGGARLLAGGGPHLAARPRQRQGLALARGGAGARAQGGAGDDRGARRSAQLADAARRPRRAAARRSIRCSASTPRSAGRSGRRA